MNRDYFIAANSIRLNMGTSIDQITEMPTDHFDHPPRSQNDFRCLGIAPDVVPAGAKDHPA